MYHKGFKDALYVATWMLIWTALRAAVITYALVPLGTRWVAKPKLYDEQKKVAITGARRLRRIKVWEKNITRFAEQSWCVIFYIVNLSLGLHIAYHSDYWFNPAGFWTGSPHVELQGIVKVSGAEGHLAASRDCSLTLISHSRNIPSSTTLHSVATGSICSLSSMSKLGARTTGRCSPITL
jgi:hypothetical protein